MSIADGIRRRLDETRSPTLADRKRRAECKTPRTRQRDWDGAMQGEQARQVLIRKIETAHKQSTFGAELPAWIYEARTDELRGHMRLLAARGHCCVGATAGLARRTSGLECGSSVLVRRK